MQKIVSLTTEAPVGSKFSPDVIAEIGAAANTTGKVSKGELVFNVKDYGATGLGVVSERQAFVDAISAMPAKGGTLYVPPGTYNDPCIRNAGKSLRIEMDNVALVQTLPAAVIYMLGSWGTTRNVTAIAETNYTPAAGENALAHSLTIAGASGFYKAGDRIWVFADDTIPERRLTDGIIEDRIGQWAVVENVVGDVVQLTQRLRDNYTTNIRVSTLNDLPIEIRGDFSIDTVEQGMTEKWGNTLCHFESLRYPKVSGVRILRGSNVGFMFRSCFGYHVSDYDISNLANDPTESQLGYAFADSASSYGYIGNGLAQNCRHGYTDVGPRVAAGATAPGSYGRSYATIVDGMHVIGSSSDAISPHQCGEGQIFINCTAEGGRGGGFGIRGKNHQYINCKSINNPRDFRLITDVDGGETYGIQIVNPFVSKTADAGSASITLSNHTGATDPLKGVRNGKVVATVSGGTFTGVARWLNVINAVVKVVNNPIVFAPATLPTDNPTIEGTNSIIEIESVTLDYRDNTAGATPRVVQLNDGTSELRADSFRLRDTTDFNTRMLNIFSGSSSPSWFVGELVTETFGSSASPISGSYTVAAYKLRKSDGSATSRYISRTSANVATAQNYGHIIDPSIFVRVSATTDVDLTFGNLGSGNHVGQQVTIYYQNSSFSTRTLTIRNLSSAGTQWEPASNVVLTHRTSATLVWEGTYWRLVTAPSVAGATTVTAAQITDSGATGRSLVQAATAAAAKTAMSLGSVDNTTDLGKPISTATQTALDGKAATSHSHTIANVTGLQTALDAKEPKGINITQAAFDALGAGLDVNQTYYIIG